MPYLDARAICRVAQNHRCCRQAALPLLRLHEQEAYALLTGRPYPGPRGERRAALAWGCQFEARLSEHRARRLLGALEGVLGIPADAATVRDLRVEVPGTKPDALAERTRRTRVILTDLLAGRPVPDLLLQSPLALSWGGTDWGTIIPDALVLDPRQRRYVPLEAKAYVAVDGIVTAGERAAMRLQAAVEICALRSELARLDPGSTVTPRALLVLATPYGFRPAPAVLEDLQAELAAVEAALRTLARVGAHLAVGQESRSVPELLTQLPLHYRDSCLTACALAEVCRAQAPGVQGELGEHAAQLLGEELDLARLVALLSGTPPSTPEEAGLLASLEETAARFGWRAL